MKKKYLIIIEGIKDCKNPDCILRVVPMDHQIFGEESSGVIFFA